MSSPLQPRGPLPARVYWTRRLLVLGVAVLLVVLVAQLLGGGSDAKSGSDARATTVSAESGTGPEAEAGSSSGTTATDPLEETREPARRGDARTSPKERRRTHKSPAPAAPSGPCAASDIEAEPVVRKAVGGSDVTVRVKLTTRVAEACTWEVSADSLTLKITSGNDDIWSSQHCPDAVPTEEVVVRREQPVSVDVVWESARRSDEDCSGNTEWAMPGWYHAKAAALGGAPTDVQFELTRPVGGTVTRTVTPEPQPKSQDESHGSAGGGERTGHRAGDDGAGSDEPQG